MHVKIGQGQKKELHWVENAIIQLDKGNLRVADFKPNSSGKILLLLAGPPLNPDVDPDDEKGAVRLDVAT